MHNYFIMNRMLVRILTQINECLYRMACSVKDPLCFCQRYISTASPCPDRRRIEGNCHINTIVLVIKAAVCRALWLWLRRTSINQSVVAVKCLLVVRWTVSAVWDTPLLALWKLSQCWTSHNSWGVFSQTFHIVHRYSFDYELSILYSVGINSIDTFL